MQCSGETTQSKDLRPRRNTSTATAPGPVTNSISFLLAFYNQEVIVKSSFLPTQYQSFHSLFLSVLEAPHLVWHTLQIPCLSEFLEATYEASLGALEGRCISSKSSPRVQH